MDKSIGIKVDELLKLEMFDGAKVLAGQNGLANTITKVNVMEVPDVIKWLKAGEFLLTTGFSIKDDLLRLNDMIPKMKRIGVVGLGIKTKRYIDELPQSVIETAERLDFPIIDMPADISYGDVIARVLSEIVNKQAEILKQIDRFNSRLTDIMLQGGNLKEISEAMYQALGVPVAIVEDVFKTFELSADKQFKMLAEPIVQHLQKKKVKYDALTHKKKKFIETTDIINHEVVSRIMIPINTEDRNYGYVIIWDLNDVMTDKKIVIVEAATSLIALNLVKKLSVFENENKHRIEFIEELLSDEESEQSKAIDKSGYFEFNTELSYGVVVVAINEASSDVRFTPNNNRYLQYLNTKLVTAVERLHRFHKSKVIYGNKSDRLIMLIGLENQVNVKEEMMNICYELKRYLDAEKLDGKISIGIGRHYSHYRELYKSYQEAKRAVENILINKSSDSLLHFDELGIYRILSHEELLPELSQFYLEMLGSLVTYDKEKDAELIETLKTYFKCGCNVKRVSEEMFTHYNTVIYRLQRIKEIADVNLDDPETALNIHIALKISDILSVN